LLQEEKLKEFFKKVDMKSLGLKMIDFYVMISGGVNK